MKKDITTPTQKESIFNKIEDLNEKKENLIFGINKTKDEDLLFIWTLEVEMIENNIEFLKHKLFNS
jgi:hypothetical protein